MAKKDYERAARIAQESSPLMYSDGTPIDGMYDRECQRAVVEAFVALFRDDNPRFDEARFRAACVPGANVRARPRKGNNG